MKTNEVKSETIHVRVTETHKKTLAKIAMKENRTLSKVLQIWIDKLVKKGSL